MVIIASIVQLREKNKILSLIKRLKRVKAVKTEDARLLFRRLGPSARMLRVLPIS